MHACVVVGSCKRLHACWLLLCILRDEPMRPAGGGSRDGRAVATVPHVAGVARAEAILHGEAARHYPAWPRTGPHSAASEVSGTRGLPGGTRRVASTGATLAVGYA